MLHQLSAISRVISTCPSAATSRGERVQARRCGPVYPVIMLVGLAAILVQAGCSSPPATDALPPNNLDEMKTTEIRIGQHRFQTWLALTESQRQHGLMQVKADRLESFTDPQDPAGGLVHRGMLFVFPYEMPLSFWMANTITALDIAYIAPDGRIVKTYTMAPLETRIYPSIEAAQYALEVRAGLFAELGIAAGMHVEIPESVGEDVLKANR